jgi:predicted adenylyl cyclase CyaB
MDDNLLTIQQASKYLKVHWQTIRNYIEKGLITPIKIGRTIRIKKDDLEKFNENITQKREVELRFVLKNKIEIEDRLRAMQAKLTNHSHIIDHYYCPLSVNNMKEKDDWYDSPKGSALRLREIDNDYTGKIVTTLEVKKLAGPDYNDHSNCLEAEIEVTDFKEAERLILMLNNKKFMIIDKERFLYRFEDMKFCFDDIKDYGHGLEIEMITTEPVNEIKDKIFKMASKLGLTKNDLAKRSFTHEAMTKLARF